MTAKADEGRPKICPKCGYDHDNPESATAAMRILACALPEYGFISRHEELNNPSGERQLIYVAGVDEQTTEKEP